MTLTIKEIDRIHTWYVDHVAAPGTQNNDEDRQLSAKLEREKERLIKDGTL